MIRRWRRGAGVGRDGRKSTWGKGETGRTVSDGSGDSDGDVRRVSLRAMNDGGDVHESPPNQCAWQAALARNGARVYRRD